MVISLQTKLIIIIHFPPQPTTQHVTITAQLTELLFAHNRLFLQHHHCELDAFEESRMILKDVSFHLNFFCLRKKIVCICSMEMQEKQEKVF